MGFWKQVLSCGIFGFTVEERRAVIRGSIEDFTNVCRELRDVRRIRSIAGGLGLKVADKLDERWLHFRYLQAKFIYGLSLQRSYGGDGVIPSDTILEHDIHDLEYLILGLHAETFATMESQRRYQKIGWKFKLLCPAGSVIDH